MLRDPTQCRPPVDIHPETVNMIKQQLYRFGVVAAMATVVLLASPLAAAAQEPAGWGDPLVFHTFSIAAVDSATGESGVAGQGSVRSFWPPSTPKYGRPWLRSAAAATRAAPRIISESPSGSFMA